MFGCRCGRGCSRFVVAPPRSSSLTGVAYFEGSVHNLLEDIFLGFAFVSPLPFVFVAVLCLWWWLFSCRVVLGTHRCVLKKEVEEVEVGDE